MTILITELKIRGAKINDNQDPTAKDKNRPYPVQGCKKSNYTVKMTVNSDQLGL